MVKCQPCMECDIILPVHVPPYQKGTLKEIVHTLNRRNIFVLAADTTVIVQVNY